MRPQKHRFAGAMLGSRTIYCDSQYRGASVVGDPDRAVMGDGETNRSAGRPVPGLQIPTGSQDGGLRGRSWATT
jgi:hypothetical protein